MDLSKLKQQEAASLNTRRPHREGADIRRGSTETKQQGKQACLLFVGNWMQNLSFIDEKEQSRKYAERTENSLLKASSFECWTRSFCSFSANTSRNLNGTPGKGCLRLLQVLKESAWTLKPAKSLKNKQTEKYEDFQLSQRTIRTNRDASETSQKTNGLMDVNNSPINPTGGKKKQTSRPEPLSDNIYSCNMCQWYEKWVPFITTERFRTYFRVFKTLHLSLKYDRCSGSK